MKKIILPCVLALAACQPDQSASEDAADVHAKDAETETCSACGMVIREQPAPRGQVIHRDGTREFLCSIDDLVRYLDVPSPNGRPQRIFAEVMSENHDLDDMDASFHPWDDAAKLFFVTGIDRGAVMGEAAMTYRTKDAASNAAEKFGGRVVTFDQLREQTKK